MEPGGLGSIFNFIFSLVIASIFVAIVIALIVAGVNYESGWSPHVTVATPGQLQPSVPPRALSAR